MMCIIDANYIDLITMMKKKKLELSDLKVYGICIVRHPMFRFVTNKGTFFINYTQNNYKTLVNILELLEYKEIDLFKKKVRTFIICPKDERVTKWPENGHR
jgi:hypothetical protein